jgi:hypothetical protein
MRQTVSADTNLVNPAKTGAGQEFTGLAAAVLLDIGGCLDLELGIWSFPRSIGGALTAEWGPRLG